MAIIFLLLLFKKSKNSNDIKRTFNQDISVRYLPPKYFEAEFYGRLSKNKLKGSFTPY
jgi:hypothetical protein